mmetsp:Transcript_6032/g.10976  ORF Transcript_6032/g.10976 Transcript_6032/m.10976 type:complete len:203 (-) Transcript_6032:2004-2612(-)
MRVGFPRAGCRRKRGVGDGRSGGWLREAGHGLRGPAGATAEAGRRGRHGRERQGRAERVRVDGLSAARRRRRHRARSGGRVPKVVGVLRRSGIGRPTAAAAKAGGRASCSAAQRVLAGFRWPARAGKRCVASGARVGGQRVPHRRARGGGRPFQPSDAPPFWRGSAGCRLVQSGRRRRRTGSRSHGSRHRKGWRLCAAGPRH